MAALESVFLLHALTVTASRTIKINASKRQLTNADIVAMTLKEIP